MKQPFARLLAVLCMAVFATPSSAQIFQARRFETLDAGHVPGVMFDIDRNGYKDYFVFKNNNPAFFLADSSGLATRAVLMSDLVPAMAGYTVGTSRKPFVTDIENDGNPELVFHLATIGLVRLSYDLATSAYGISTLVPQASLPISAFNTVSGDFNGDGRIDFILSSTTTVLFLQQPSGAFAGQTVITGLAIASPVVADDMDNDGDLDFIVAGGSPVRLKLYRNNGSGTFTMQDLATLSISGRTYSSANSGLVIGDVDSDGDKDIVLGSSSATWVALYRNTNGVFTEEVLRAPLSGSGGVQITLTDHDADGDLDIIAGRPSLSTTGYTGLSIFRNSGGAFAAERSVFDYQPSYPVNLTIAGLSEDFNNDGKPDYLITHGANWYIISTKFNYLSHPLWASVMENYLAGDSRDLVTVHIVNPFRASMQTGYIYEGTYDGVTGWGHNTDSIYLNGPLGQINLVMRWIEYTGYYGGKQYFDIKYTNHTSGEYFTNRIWFELTDPWLQTLPVDLISFTARVQQQSVRLDWKTATETSTSHFDIERATGGNEFRKIGQVNAQGNSSTATSYHFIDNDAAAGMNKYRLKMTDIDGKFTYSKIVTATIRKESALTVHPVPANNQVTIQADAPLVSVDITDLLGRTVRRKTVGSGIKTLQINIADLKPGAYYIRTAAGSGKLVKE